MKLAIIGSRNLNLDISKFIPIGVTEIVSGGAKGIDALAEIYAKERNIPIIIIKPEYDLFGRAAPLKRNEQIVETSDMLLAIWDGKSRGTKYTIDYANKTGKPVQVHVVCINEKNQSNDIGYKLDNFRP